MRWKCWQNCRICSEKFIQLCVPTSSRNICIYWFWAASYAHVIGLPPGLYVGELGTLWELSNKNELWREKCGDIDLWCPNSQGKCGDFPSGKARGDWQQVVFSLGWHGWYDEKIQKRSASENEEVYVKIHRLFFFSVHEIDHLSNISMNRTAEQLEENWGEKKKDS